MPRCSARRRPSLFPPTHPPTHTLTDTSLPLSLQGCNSVLYFEARKHKDLYLWLAKAPGGPSVKFHVTNGGRQAPAPAAPALLRIPCACAASGAPAATRPARPAPEARHWPRCWPSCRLPHADAAAAAQET